MSTKVVLFKEKLSISAHFFVIVQNNTIFNTYTNN